LRSSECVEDARLIAIPALHALHERLQVHSLAAQDAVTAVHLGFTAWVAGEVAQCCKSGCCDTWLLHRLARTYIEDIKRLWGWLSAAVGPGALLQSLLSPGVCHSVLPSFLQCLHHTTMPSPCRRRCEIHRVLALHIERQVLQIRETSNRRSPRSTLQG
jgi:hypothetical protein